MKQNRVKDLNRILSEDIEIAKLKFYNGLNTHPVTVKNNIYTFLTDTKYPIVWYPKSTNISLLESYWDFTITEKNIITPILKKLIFLKEFVLK